MSLRYKIVFLFTLAIVLPALLSSIILTSISKHTIHTLLFNQQYELLNRIAERINSQVENHQNLLVQNKTITGLPVQKQALAAKNVLERGKAFYEISLIDPNGRELWKFRKTGRANDLLKRAGREEFSEAKRGRNYISRVSFSNQRNPFIVFSVPCQKPGYVLSAKFDLAPVWLWVSEIRIAETGSAFVVDKNGDLLAHKDTERVFAHSNFSGLPVVKDFMDGKKIAPDTWRQYEGEDGQKVVSLYCTVPKLGWAVVTQAPYREVYRPISTMYKSVFGWTVVWVLLFWFLGYRFVRRIVGPVEQLRSGAAQISRGKLDIKFEINTGDEIQELAGDFEKMAVSLRELEDLRQDLIKMIIHDLKGPLSGIMGGLEYLESGMMGDLNDDQKKVVNISKKSSENLLVMIQNLLDVAKMEEGKLELRKEKVELKDILAERQSQFDALAKKEGKTITLSPGADALSADVDKILIERVLNNLITNALHHTSSGGKIVLDLKKKDGFVLLSVSDDGMGIPEEYKDKIFEKFVQVKRKQAHLRTGVGLGLTFCKMVIETHGGSIKVESELDKGSAFICSLPV
jgi:signal transduction histidine kinase